MQTSSSNFRHSTKLAKALLVTPFGGGRKGEHFRANKLQYAEIW